LASFFHLRQPSQHVQVFESGGVTFDFGAGGDLFEEAAHDFSGAGLGQRFGKTDIVRLGDRADFFGDVVSKFIAQGGFGQNAAFERNERNKGLAFESVRPADDCGF